MTLPRSCPIGFTFVWNRDDPRPEAPRVTWTLTGWLSVGEKGQDAVPMPMFEASDDEGYRRWSSRLESVAEQAWRKSCVETAS